jgi:hypothetical protein
MTEARDLIFKRARWSRLSGEWSEDDYDVLAAGEVVGRIMKAAAAPEGTEELAPRGAVRARVRH